MRLTTATWMFLDTETTGLKPKEGARVIEFGSAFIENMRVTETYDFLIHPGGPIPSKITQITGISDKMVANKPKFEQIADGLMSQFRAAEFVAAYNKDFDRDMLNNEFQKLGMQLPEIVWLDPMVWAQSFIHDVGNHRLKTVADQFKVDLTRAHRADADAEAGAKILIDFFRWGMEEANFPDDVEALKELERGWRKDVRAKQRIMDPLRKWSTDPSTGERKRQITMTGEPGKVAQNVYDNHIRDRFNKLHEMSKWRK